MAQSHGDGAGLQLPPCRSAGQLAEGLRELGDCEAVLLALPGLLEPGHPAEELARRALGALTRGLPLLHAAAAASKVEEDEVGSLLAQLPPTATSPYYSAERRGMLSRQPKAGVVGAAEKKAGHRRRSHPYSFKEITSTTLDDCYTWRKYGQKDIQNSSEPRSYYRCTYKKSRGCQAQRQAQKREDGSGLYQITYFNDHTCDIPAAAAHNRKDQQGQQKLPQRSQLISFTLDGAGAGATVPPLPASIRAPCKQEPAAMPSDHVEVVTTSRDEAKPGIAAESTSLPPLCSGFYCGGEKQQGNASPGQSSTASSLSHEDMDYLEDLDLTNLLTLENPDDFSRFDFSF